MSESFDPQTDVYYRILLGGDGVIYIATMQWFDEYDYSQNCFITQEKFASEDDARAFLRKAYVRIKELDFPEKLKAAIGDFLSDDGVCNILDHLDEFEAA